MKLTKSTIFIKLTRPACDNILEKKRGTGYRLHIDTEVSCPVSVQLCVVATGRMNCNVRTYIMKLTF
jgi:hypothetical protein